MKKTALILSYQQIAFVFMLSTYSYYVEKCIHMLEAETIIRFVDKRIDSIVFQINHEFFIITQNRSQI